MLACFLALVFMLPSRPVICVSILMQVVMPTLLVVAACGGLAFELWFGRRLQL